MNARKTAGKRILEPTFTEGYIHLPNLKRKLKWLFGFRPLVDTNYKVAGELGVAPSTFAGWLKGEWIDDGRNIAIVNPESIPIEYFSKFVGIWGLPRAVLEIESLDEFRNALDAFQAGRGAWDKLVCDVADGDAIEIVVANATRGIIDPDDLENPGILRFNPGDEILIRVANPGLRYGLMLLQDRLGWFCLRPTVHWKETEIGDYLVFPRQLPNEPPRFATLDMVGGVHRVLAILMNEHPPAEIIDILSNRPIDVGGLNHTAAVFQKRSAAGPDQCRMLSRQFLVVSRRS